MKYAVLTGLLCLITLCLRAQEADTLLLPEPAPDTLAEQAAKRFAPFAWFSKDYPDPKKALMFSVFPGGGQIYNKKWWKLPIVYAGMGGMVYLIDRNSTEYLYFKRAYRRSVRGLPHDLSGRGGLDNPTTLKRFRDQADKNAQYSYMGLIAVFGLAAMDAFVDAHLRTFDVSDDLSLELGVREMGVGVALRF
jgi:hypothetical protein